MRRKFNKVKDGEWVQPNMRGYLMKCCDCGLVHKLDFMVLKLVKRSGSYKVGEPVSGHYIRFKATRA
jgi:hypothetical protein